MPRRPTGALLLLVLPVAAFRTIVPALLAVSLGWSSSSRGSSGCCPDVARGGAAVLR